MQPGPQDVLSGGPARADLVRDVLARFGRVRLRVRGTSMWPALRDGDVVEVRPHAGRVIAGDIVLFMRDGALVVHRVVDAAPQGLITRGDALRSCDPPLGGGQLLGLVTAVDRNGRPLRRALHERALLADCLGRLRNLEATSRALAAAARLRRRLAARPHATARRLDHATSAPGW